MAFKKIPKGLCAGIILAMGFACGGQVFAQSANSALVVEPLPIGKDALKAPPKRKARPGEAVIQRIIVEGTKRIEPATVRSYLTLVPGDPFDTTQEDLSLKKLYQTGLFSKVDFQQNGNNLVIKVEENPIVNRVAFEGNKRIEDKDLATQIQLKPRYVYSRTKIQADVQHIIELYRRSGRYTVSVTPQLIKLPQNRVNVIFKIKEGSQTGVRRISFVGNNFFSDNALRTVITTKETRWYRFFTSTDVYDPDRLKFDKELLRRYYNNYGFPDMRSTSSVAQLSEDQKGFFITTTIDEGLRYRYSGFDVKSNLHGLDAKELSDVVDIDKGDWFDGREVEKAVTDLVAAAGNQGYAFVKVTPKLIRDKKNKTVKINFVVQEGPPTYIELINIVGNTRTQDEVIRREMRISEGDAFNAALIRRSRERIQSLGYFKKVDITTQPGSSPDRTVLQVKVQEERTGELVLGGGYSTVDGVLGQVTARERNLLGRGLDVSLSGSLAQRRQSVDFSLTDPYFLGYDMSAGIDIFSTTRNKYGSLSYDTKRLGFNLRAGYELDEHWREDWRYGLSQEKVTNIDDDASIFVKRSAGKTTRSLVGHTLSYDTRNNRRDPTRGFYAAWDVQVSGLGGDVHSLQNTLETRYYFPLWENAIGVLRGRLGYLKGLGEDTRLNDRFFMGGASFRGFEAAGIGPRDKLTNDPLGGQFYAIGTAEMRFPLGLPKELGVRGALFTDFGTIYDSDDKGPRVQDDSKLRASAGFGLEWRSPAGRIRLDFAWAFLKEDYDKPEVFRLSFGTRF